MSRRWPWRTSSPGSCGRCGCSIARSRPTPDTGHRGFDARSPRGLHRGPHLGAPVGPARGKADNSAGREGPSKLLAPRARISMMARSRAGSTDEAEDTTAVRPSCNALRTTTNPGAPRASRSCGRLRRCATRSLGPCSRRGLGAARPTKERPSWAVQRDDVLSQRFFLLDGGVQIPRLGGLLCRVLGRQ